MSHNNLAKIRADAGMTQMELGKAIGVSQQTIYYYEHGERDMRASVLKRLAEALGCKVSDILGIEEEIETYALTQDERRLLDLYRRTDQRGRETIMALATFQVEKSE